MSNRYPGKFEGCDDARLGEILQVSGCAREAGDVSEIGEWYGLIIQRKHAYIVSEDSSGFFDYTFFESIEDAEKKFDAIEWDLQEAMGPQEEDLTISSNGFRYSVGIVGGDFIGIFADWDDAENAAREWMKKQNYYPTCWSVSDHGNASIITIPEVSK